jgi:hypothetical protein
MQTKNSPVSCSSHFSLGKAKNSTTIARQESQSACLLSDVIWFKAIHVVFQQKAVLIFIVMQLKQKSQPILAISGQPSSKWRRTTSTVECTSAVEFEL